MTSHALRDRAISLHQEGRFAEAEQFYRQILAQNPDAIAMLRDLLHLRTTPDAQVITHFNQLYAKHKPAIIVPEGAHFDTSGTDIQFTSQVYTIRIAGLS